MLFVVILVLTICCCFADNLYFNPPNSLGKYIYIDNNRVHHARYNCPMIPSTPGKYGNQQMIKQQIDTAQFMVSKKRAEINVCAYCISDNLCSKLLNIAIEHQAGYIYDITVHHGESHFGYGWATTEWEPDTTQSKK